MRKSRGRRNLAESTKKDEEGAGGGKEGRKETLVRQISKSTTHNFLRTTNSLQKMSSGCDKHSVER